MSTESITAARLSLNCGGAVRYVLLAAFAALLWPAAGTARGQCSANETAKLLMPGGVVGDQFGRSVSIDGDAALIGAPLDDGSGSVQVFRFRQGRWVEEARLLASVRSVPDQFGFSVSLSGDVALVGSPGVADNGLSSGAAYVFRWVGDRWTEEARLIPSDNARFDIFGHSVSVSGDVALVGAYFDDDNGRDSGSAYVFRFDGEHWVEEVKLLASDGKASDEFGYSVSIDGDVAVIGARLDDDRGDRSGAAYLFRSDGRNWNQEAKLLASDGAPGDMFGFSVSISETAAIVGAPNADGNRLTSGSAYVFRFNGDSWNAEAKLLASRGRTDDDFGFAVSIHGAGAIVGAPDHGDSVGSANLFRFNGESWDERSRLRASDGSSTDSHGRSVSISGEAAIVGAHLDDDNGRDSGSAYAYDLVGIGCAPNCTGREMIKRARCRIAEGQVTAVVVTARKCKPGREYTATLDTGEVVAATAGESKRIQFKFKGENAPACGPNGVTVCDTRTAFGCDCP